MRRKLTLIILLVLLLTLGFVFFLYEKQSQKSDICPIVSDTESQGVVADVDTDDDMNEIVILDDNPDSSVTSDDINIGDDSSDVHRVSIGTFSFELTNSYEYVDIGQDAILIPGLELSEYDRESGLIVFGFMKNVSLPLEQYMYQISSNLIDTEQYIFQGKSQQTYANVDWQMEFYQTEDGSTGSLVACANVDGQLICVFLHCLWTEYTETEFVEILSSCTAS